MSQLPTPSLISELENRQDEALKALTELEQRIELALSEFGGTQSKARKQAGDATFEQTEEAELRLHDPEEPAQQPSAA